MLLLTGICAVTALMLYVFWRDDQTDDFLNRAMAAKMLVLAREGEEGLALAREASGDTPWYSYYIEEAQISCGMDSDGGDFRPMDLLTYNEASKIAGAFNADLSGLSFEFTDADADRSITLEHWCELYDVLIGSGKAVTCRELFVLGSPSNVSGLLAWQCLTDQGLFEAGGLSVDPVMDSLVTAYVCGDEIVGIRSSDDGEVTLKNFWTVKGQARSVTVFLFGYYRTFELDAPLAEPVEKVMADVTFGGRQMIRMTLKPTVIKGEILAVGDGYVEIQNYGKVFMTDDFCVLSLEDGISGKSLDALKAGSKYTEFVVDGDRICAALIRAGDQAETIRVVISCDGYTGYDHASVKLTSSVPFWTVYSGSGGTDGQDSGSAAAGAAGGNGADGSTGSSDADGSTGVNAAGSRTDYEAGAVVEIDRTMLDVGETITVQTAQTAGTVELLSLNRSCGHPRYRGSLEITNTGEGLRIVNELLLEEYLYAVVPSEMPASYGTEALKVQAICARSFAKDALNHPHFQQWGVHVDDSTATQVYNNAGEFSEATEAVDATAGQVMTWQGQVVTAYFYSTSCGSSSSPGEVWLSGEALQYIRGRLQLIGDGERDLSSEEAFRSFIDDYAAVDYFEKDVSWFRWRTTVTRADIRTAIDKSLLTRIRIVPEQITVRDDQGNFAEKEISTIGDVLHVRTGQRGTSGVLTSVIVEGSEAAIKISGEYNIRLLLAPLYSDVICDDGTNAGAMTMLPSGYFYIDDNGDGSYTLRGGGYGHGVGMSQNGVRALAERGWTCEQILSYYFEGIQLS